MTETINSMFGVTDERMSDLMDRFYSDMSTNVEVAKAIESSEDITPSEKLLLFYGLGQIVANEMMSGAIPFSNQVH